MKMSYREWLQSVPEELTGDCLWKVEAYRLALFSSDVAWLDATRLAGDSRTRSLADQLYRAVGSISANIAEGYSRSSGKDRARFYEYSLGSAREARDWYYKSRHVLTTKVCDHRLQLCGQLVRLLLTMVPDNRGSILRDEPIAYGEGNWETGFVDDSAKIPF